MKSLKIISNVALKNIKQLLNQKQILAASIVAPALMFYLMSLVFTDKKAAIDIALHNAPVQFVKILENANPPDQSDQNKITHFNSLVEMKEGMKNMSYELGIDFNNDKDFQLYIGTTSYTKNSVIFGIMTQVLMQYNIANFTQLQQKGNADIIAQLRKQLPPSALPALQKISTPKEEQLSQFEELTHLKDNTTYIYPIKSFRMFETVAPAILAAMLVFFVFMISGMAFLGEKRSGTLERILISPLKLSQLIIGYLVSFGIIAVLQIVVMQLFYYYVLRLQSHGSFISVFVICFCAGFAAITFGMFISSFAKSEFSVLQMIPISLVPQMAFSGLFDISSLPNVVQYIADFLPMTYCVRALQKVMLMDLDMHYAIKECIALVLIGFIFILLTYTQLSVYKPKIKPLK